MRRKRGRERQWWSEWNGNKSFAGSSRIASRGWEAERRGSLSDTNFVPPDGNTQKLAAFVVFGILTGHGLVFKYFHIFPGALSLDVDLLNPQICGTNVTTCIYILNMLSYCTYSHTSISISVCIWKSPYSTEEWNTDYQSRDIPQKLWHYSQNRFCI